MEHPLGMELIRSSHLPEIVGPDFKAHWKEGVSNEDYHADRSAVSSSGLKIILNKSPRHFHYHWTSGAPDEEESNALRFGSLCHMALLQSDLFRESYKVEPIFEGPTKDGVMSSRSKIALIRKAEWHKKLRRGTLVVTQKDYDMITGIVYSVLDHPVANGIIADGTPEISGWFRDPDTGIKCRIRPDIFGQQSLSLSDFKTARDASADEFAKQMGNLMYHVSMAMYYDGVFQITGQYPKVTSFIPVEKDPPYACAVYAVSQEDIEIGRAWYKHALALLKECMTKEKWPSYQHEAQDIELKPWHKNKALPLYDFRDTP